MPWRYAHNVNYQSTVVIDASTARRGGGLTVAYELVRRLPNWSSINWQVLISPELAQMLVNEPMSNVKVHVAFDTELDAVRHFQRWLDLGTLIRATRADAILCLGNYGFHIGRRPSIVVVQLDLEAAHSYDSLRSRLAWYLIHSRIRHSVSVADRVIAVSDHIGDQLAARFGCDRSSIRTVPLAGQIDMITDNCVPPTYLLDWAPYIFAISGTQDYKNIQVLLDAAHLLVERSVCNTRLVIAGVDEATACKQGYRCDSSVTWAGQIPRSELAYVYQNAAMYVHHSMAESFALPVLEAMRCSTLAIATDAPWARSIYHDVIPTFQPNASDLASVIQYYLSNECERQRVIAQQRVFAEKFSWDAMAERLVESVMDVIAEQRQR